MVTLQKPSLLTWNWGRKVLGLKQFIFPWKSACWQVIYWHWWHMAEETQQWPKVIFSDVWDLGEHCWDLAQAPFHFWLKTRRATHQHKQDRVMLRWQHTMLHISHARWTSWILVSVFWLHGYFYACDKINICYIKNMHTNMHNFVANALPFKSLGSECFKNTFTDKKWILVLRMQ